MYDINITEYNLQAFKHAKLEAEEEGKDTFIFNDKPVLTSYADYVIQYLEQQLEQQNTQ